MSKQPKFAFENDEKIEIPLPGGKVIVITHNHINKPEIDGFRISYDLRARPFIKVISAGEHI